MRILALILLFGSLLFGSNYNYILLEAQATIFPKIMLLDKRLEEKLVDGKIVFIVVYEKSDHTTALEISRLIKSIYINNMDKYKYIVELVEFTDLTNSTEATAIYALNSNSHIANAAKIANEKGIIAFSYDNNNLKKGMLFSLMLEKSTVLYLNKDNIPKKKVDFVDSLYQIVRFIDKDNG
ncbi:MAG: hypothetical protein L3J19_01635 [Sulfurimonas sp.]|nr:hypothetical protein [Sulfurimonas sp.]